MYQKPQLQRFGTFRELTLGGGNTVNDTFSPQNNDNCSIPDPNTLICKKS